jgi:hypothetical protein
MGVLAALALAKKSKLARWPNVRDEPPGELLFSLRIAAEERLPTRSRPDCME